MIAKQTIGLDYQIASGPPIAANSECYMLSTIWHSWNTWLSHVSKLGIGAISQRNFPHEIFMQAHTHYQLYITAALH